MSWEKEIEELRRREALARRVGEPDKVKRQHDGGIKLKFLSVKPWLLEAVPCDTRKLLCEFAELAAPLRSAFGVRP